jgi:hypothetical protein
MAVIDVSLKQQALIKFLVVSDGKLTSINERLFKVHGETTGSVSVVEQLARLKAEAEKVGGEHNEIMWSHHSHTVIMCDNICWVDELIYNDPSTNMDDLHSNTCIGKNSVISIIDELGYFKIYAVGVPRLLNDVHKAARKSAVTDFCTYMVQECNMSRKIMAAVFWD